MKPGDIAKNKDTKKVGLVVDIGPVWTALNTDTGKCYVQTSKLTVIFPLNKN